MTGEWLDLVWLILLLAAAAWLIAALLVPTMLRPLLGDERDPVARSRRMLLVAALPWLVPATLASAMIFTAGAKAIGWMTDHCPHHGLGHPHLCFTHLPAIDLGLVHGAFALVVLSLLGTGVYRLILSQRGASRQVALLKALAPSRGRLRILPDRMPLALAGGILKPVVLLSRGLLDQLSSRDRRIVAAHETAHIRHGDARRSFLFEGLLLVHLPAVRRGLRAQWLQTLEEQADDAVARRFGAESVAEALLRVARINLRVAPTRFSVAGADPLHRARRLLDGRPASAASRELFELGYAMALAAVFAAAVTGHHALETLLGLLAGR